MDIPSLFMIPSAVSSGKVHSVFPNSTDADFDFNRDSSATRVNSQGLIEEVGYFGSEEVIDGNFNNGLTNWIVSGTDSTHFVEAVSTGARFVSDTVSPVLELKQNAITSGKQYVLTCNVIYTGAGQLRVNVGSNLPAFTEGANTRYFTATSNTMSFLRENANVDAIISNVSVKEVTGDRARLNYEIEGGLVNTKPSLLLEPQSTNLFTKSNDVDATAATKLDNQITSPEGLENAALYVENTATASHGAIKSAILPTAGATTYTLSVFAKAKERHLLRLNIYANGTSNLTDNFDLINGTVSDANSTIEDFGNGWFRCSTTKTVTNSGGYNFAAVYMGKATNNYYYAGDGQSGLYLFGFQLEQQSYATSYIPTNGSTQTRAAETCNGAGTSSILPSEEGILYCEIAGLGHTSTSEVLSISNGSSSNTLYLGFPTTANVIQAQLIVGGAAQTNMNHTVSDTLIFNKVAVLFRNNNHKMFIGGVEVETDTSGSTPSAGTLDRINFDLGQGSFDFYGKIRDIRVYNTKEMTDSEVDILLTKITS